MPLAQISCARTGQGASGNEVGRPGLQHSTVDPFGVASAGGFEDRLTREKHIYGVRGASGGSPICSLAVLHYGAQNRRGPNSPLAPATFAAADANFSQLLRAGCAMGL